MVSLRILLTYRSFHVDPARLTNLTLASC
uniref:Uncharacterized protein n=1 Tax=Anguilla anguilla TaxID=7936 RepID=A0A0E9USJ0_ANGAN